MSALYILLAGFLLGLRHALDADHLAAVASLVTRSRSMGETVRTGIAWGIGHTVTLFLVSGVVIAMGVSFPDRIVGLLEFLVGVMLVLLGGDVLRRLIRERMHVHGHKHAAEKYHIHFHSHEGETDHSESHHEHQHTNGLPRRALAVGLMHGLAGSAALLLIAVIDQGSTMGALGYVLLFGLGSMIGMALLSCVIALPLMSAARAGTVSFKGLNAVIGTGTTALGGFLMYETAPGVISLLSLA
ncbi:MAG: urease accessory protein [Rhodospirillaceae bacterium]|jgi:ABC-type nickel/cobalt efflux system permease component RcnA|nr:urease accessory protein [Rhodospirillaceae bacterium]MBT5049546.1 urease accessory protein [Rhodospirillaceae bacterium]MBT5459121.1 urease accessory protein [Rhodospirillaceae bacterium]